MRLDTSVGSAAIARRAAPFACKASRVSLGVSLDPPSASPGSSPSCREPRGRAAGSHWASGALGTAEAASSRAERAALGQRWHVRSGRTGRTRLSSAGCGRSDLPLRERALSCFSTGRDCQRIPSNSWAGGIRSARARRTIVPRRGSRPARSSRLISVRCRSHAAPSASWESPSRVR